MVEVLGAAAVVGSGIVAGVFFAIAVSVMPTLMALPTSSYIEIHRSLGKGYHPVMPLIVSGALIAELALVVLAPNTTTRVLFVASVVCTVGVQVVSQFGNVPINKRVQAVDAEALPPDWPDPRRPWRDWHHLRTVFALLALALNGAAVTLLR
jgi:uncharacterized membrane protein